MTPTELQVALTFAFANRFPFVIVGPPGIGKSDIVDQAARDAGCDMILSHPVVSDPTDFKGLPFAGKDGADFLPYGDLRQAITAKKPTVFFLDDLGQAPASVQAACMQMLLARQINGKKISNMVTFVAATNRKEDKAAVSGMLEPVKSRFISIVNLEVNTDDWVRWALNKGNMPIELIAFIRFRPALLNDFKATKEIINSPSPRTVANVGKMINAGIPKGLEFELIKGAAGEGFATEYKGFLDLYANLPDIDKIFFHPDTVEVPKNPGIICAVSAAIAHKINTTNADNAFKYIKRLPAEVGVACVKDCITKDGITSTRGYVEWATSNGNLMLG